MNRMIMMAAAVAFGLAFSGCAGGEEEPAQAEVIQQIGECSVTLQCPSAPTISCSGTNFQCSVGTNGVTCNGVTTTCALPSLSCVWNGATYAHGAIVNGSCTARNDGVCNTGVFLGSECGSPSQCAARCDNGDWVPRF